MLNSSSVKRSVRVVLRGVGQIMLQPSAVTGLLFLIGIGIVSPWLAVACAAGSVIGSVSGKVFKAKEDDLDKGVYGYNSALVALAVLVFHAPSALALGVAFAGSVLAAFVTKVMGKMPLPVYTAPFVIVGAIALMSAKAMGLSPSLPMVLFPWDNGHTLVSLIGVGQVMFQESALSGLLFVLGVAACAKERAAWALVGSLIGTAIALAGQQFWSLPSDEIAAGLFGYNAALAALAVGLVDKRMWPPILAAALSVPVMYSWRMTGIPVLTGPFVLAAWLVLAISKRKG